MANKPLLLSDNAFDATMLHPTYSVDNMGADDAVDHEAWRVGSNLRDLVWWTPVAQNAERSLRVDTQVETTPANILVLDREHNLRGKAVFLEGANVADFSSIAGTPIVATVPSTAGGLASDGNGCLTPEGVWWKTFTQLTARYWRIRIPAMGAGQAPIVTGLYLGKSYRLPEYLDAPAAYDYRRRLSYKRNELSEGAVRGKSRPRRFDELDLHFSLEGTDYAAFETEVTRLLDYDHPWWVCIDDSDAAGCALMRLFTVPGDLTYDPVVNPVHREIALQLEALIPRLAI
jgi:hypothetical protein